MQIMDVAVCVEMSVMCFSYLLTPTLCLLTGTPHDPSRSADQDDSFKSAKNSESSGNHTLSSPTHEDRSNPTLFPAGPLPMLASACPGWVCYAEKAHGDLVLPHVSAAKSPQVCFVCFVFHAVSVLCQSVILLTGV